MQKEMACAGKYAKREGCFFFGFGRWASDTADLRRLCSTPAKAKIEQPRA
jgi:hypothetical protein